MSSINQILNSALMESSTNLNESGSGYIGSKLVNSMNQKIDQGGIFGGVPTRSTPTGMFEVKPSKTWLDAKLSGVTDKQQRAIRGTTIGAGLLTAGGIGAMKLSTADDEQKNRESAQVAAHKMALARHSMAQSAKPPAEPPAEPPKSFVQQYGDQAKAMWDKAVADGTASWDKFNVDNPNAGKYGAAGLVALGAGIGAVALAKKLRAKKAAVKK